MMKHRGMKTVALAAAMVMLVSVFAGCGGGGETANDGKITIRIGHWPTETEASHERMEERRIQFMEENPDIIVEPDTYHWDVKSFNMLASSGQLANMMLVPFTEANKIISAGYAADITDSLADAGYLDTYNPTLIELLSDGNGRVYGMPDYAYAQGLFLNKKLFEEAGLVNADGYPMVPSTYDEVAEYGQIIREKTGRAGFVMPTTNNGGGWHFLNIAWSYGVEFLKKNEDGSYTAAFDTPEFREALQYLYDLKWKYNIVQDSSVVNTEEYRKLFGTYQGGMVLYNPPGDDLVEKYGMDMADIYAACVPAGPAGRYAQMGGNIRFMSKETTREQQDAVLKWMKYCGTSADVTEETKQRWAESAKLNAEEGKIVLGRSPFALWVNPERVQAEAEAQAPYVNVDPKNYDNYFTFADVIIRPEPEVAAQELYSVLDKGIQEIFTNPNIDLDELTKTLVNDYQENHLNKL